MAVVKEVPKPNVVKYPELEILAKGWGVTYQSLIEAIRA